MPASGGPPSNGGMRAPLMLPGNGLGGDMYALGGMSLTIDDYPDMSGLKDITDVTYTGAEIEDFEKYFAEFLTDGKGSGDVKDEDVAASAA